MPSPFWLVMQHHQRGTLDAVGRGHPPHQNSIKRARILLLSGRFQTFDQAVRGPIEANVELCHALVPLLDVRLQLYKAFLEMDRRVKALAHSDQICRLFMTAPGVGYIAALTFKAAVDDPSRFKRSRTVAAHFGLTPRRYQ
jgi:transposase